jgi:hypothetical protein
LDEWEKFYGTFFMYKMGQNALEFLAEKYGREKILLLMENFWMSEDFSTVMKKTIGKDYTAFDREWLGHLKKKYSSEQISDEQNPSTASIPIYESGFGHKPTYYRDGKREEIYFIANKTGYTNLYKVDLKDKENIITVVKGEKSEAFEEFHYFRTGLDISSKGILAFATKSGGTDALHLYDVNEEKLIKSYHFDNVVQIGSPSFTKDGNKIVFPGLDMGGKSDLYLFDVLLKNLTRLTNDYYDDRDPDVSPDSKTIVFSSDRTSYGRDNKYNLFIYELETNTISYLTNGDQVDFSPQFSPDGKKIIYTSTIGGIQNIWLTNASKGAVFEGKGEGESDNITNNEIKQLTNFTTSAFDPRWSGENKIVFASYENQKISVRMLDSTDKLIDTPKTSRQLSYDDIQNLWSIKKIKGAPRKNILKYQREYSLDIATTTISADPVFGATAGGIIAMSDLLGNDQYYFLIFNNSESGDEFFKSFNIAVSRVSLGQRMNYAYGIYHLSGRRYDYGDAFSYYERVFGGYFALSYPLSFFRRIDASISLGNSKRSLTEERVNRRSLQLTNSVSYTKDNTIFGPTGPLDGNRFSLTLAYTTDIQFGNVNYFTVIFDYRRYLRLSNATALATRIAYFMNEGEEAHRWAIGGSWDLRGWPRFGLRGKKAFVASNELRFPLFNFANINMPFGINHIFPFLRGAVFVDIGNAWDDKYYSTLGSVGAGERLNLFYVMALRYDIGKRIEGNLTRMQKGWFHQFFFGWDF